MRSKILEYLKIEDSVSDGFPQDIKEFVEIIDGSQEIYSESKDSAKREKLAELIVGWMRELMKYLQTQNLGIYANQMVSIESQAVPQEPQPIEPPTTEPPTTEPPSTPPQNPPTPPKKGGRKKSPEPPQPPVSEPPTTTTDPEPHKPEYTKEELEEAIATQEVLYELTQDEQDLNELNQLKQLYNRYYS